MLSFLLLSFKFPLASEIETQTWRMDIWTCHRVGVARGESGINWEIRNRDIYSTMFKTDS